jgi:uncharacterized glyoxalase superfamily protein PhnB
MSQELTRGWAPVYPHIRYDDPGEAIDWLVAVFGFRERARMTGSDGQVVTAKLEGPGGGLVMVAGRSEEFVDWIRQRLPGVREQDARPWPNLTHATTALVPDVDAHHDRAQAAGATVLMPPTDHPWGLRSYAAVDHGGHQWEFASVQCLLEPEAWGASRPR